MPKTLPKGPEEPLETHREITPLYWRPGQGPSLLGFSFFYCHKPHVCVCCPPPSVASDSAAYNHEKRREVSNVLRLLPLLPADGLPAEPDKLRPFSFTVISTTPGVKPLAVGVTGEQQDTQ